MPSLEERITTLEDRVRFLAGKIDALNRRTVGDMVIGPGRIESVPSRTIKEIQAQADELAERYDEALRKRKRD